MAVAKNNKKSALHEIINKEGTKTLVYISLAVFIVIFSLVASRAIFSQILYQNKIISSKKETLSIVEANKESARNLELSYISFATEPINVLGGSPAGSGPKDGDNAKIVLDALPDVLDYPALSSSIEKILLDGGYSIQALGGGGDIVSDSGDTTTSGLSDPVPIDYPLSVDTSPQAAQSLLRTLESSIRPFNVVSLKIEGASNNLSLSINMNTYYQPSSGLNVGSKVIK
jgi:hypothetical protein